MARQLDVEVAAARELLEVVAGDVGVQREVLGDLGGRRTPSRRAAHEEVDVAAGRVAEGAGDGGDRGAELVRTQGSEIRRWMPRWVFYLSSVVEIPRSALMPTEAEVLEALRPVEDPEIHRSIVDLDMVRGDRDRRAATSG